MAVCRIVVFRFLKRDFAGFYKVVCGIVVIRLLKRDFVGFISFNVEPRSITLLS